ncbi:MAG: MFS transporter [Gemmatimonadaceae bacterium]|jgi:ACS family hexuronate transporter-like MFS transporter|nr:MFS transporter [Gemmatimonadaceae bacterium]
MSTPPRAGAQRWIVCALLFLATTINYIDRQVLGILAPTLQREIGWSEADYGDIVSWFSLAYALGFLGVGRLIDRIGTRRGFAVAIVTWSAAAMSHALARTTAGFSAARFALGLGESGNFPAAIKVVAEWFPQRERALATGIFNAGSNVGAIVTPLLVPAIVMSAGWRAAFVITGALGFVWLAAWWALYRAPDEQPRLGATERAWITQDRTASDAPVPHTAAAHVRWRALLRHRAVWAFVLGKFLTDPIWWFYLYWLPKYLASVHGVTLTGLALPLVVIYLVADVGSVGGGWLSSALLSRGWSLTAARRTAMLVCALAIVPTITLGRASALWPAIALVAVAAAAHQGWSANLFTLTSDLFPSRAVASVVGLGGFAGAIGGVLFQRATGRVLDATGNDYLPIFVICGSAYLLAWMLMRLLQPRLEPVTLSVSAPE